MWMRSEETISRRGAGMKKSDCSRFHFGLKSGVWMACVEGISVLKQALR